MSSVDSVAGDSDNACRGGPVRECPVRLCRGEVSPCQSGIETARPERFRQRTRQLPWIETARDSCINRHIWRNVRLIGTSPSFLDASFAGQF